MRIDVVKAGTSRVKRMIYPTGFRWSAHMKEIVGTDWCMHAHVVLSPRVRFHRIPGWVQECAAPAVLPVEPGHDGWVIGDESAVVIELTSNAKLPAGSACQTSIHTIRSNGTLPEKPTVGPTSAG